MTTTDLVTLPEAAKALDLDYWKIYRACRTGALASARRGHYYLVRLADVRAAALDIDKRRRA